MEKLVEEHFRRLETSDVESLHSFIKAAPKSSGETILKENCKPSSTNSKPSPRIAATLSSLPTELLFEIIDLILSTTNENIYIAPTTSIFKSSERRPDLHTWTRGTFPLRQQTQIHSLRLVSKAFHAFVSDLTIRTFSVVGRRSSSDGTARQISPPRIFCRKTRDGVIKERVFIPVEMLDPTILPCLIKGLEKVETLVLYTREGRASPYLSYNNSSPLKLPSSPGLERNLCITKGWSVQVMAETDFTRRGMVPWKWQFPWREVPQVSAFGRRRDAQPLDLRYIALNNDDYYEDHQRRDGVYSALYAAVNMTRWKMSYWNGGDQVPFVLSNKDLEDGEARGYKPGFCGMGKKL